MEKVVLVTGASTGLGLAIADYLVGQGCRVFGTSRSPERYQAEVGFPLLCLDVESGASMRDCVQTVLDRAGRLDVLVNNVGQIGPAGALEEVSLAQARRLFEINFFSVVQLTNAVLPVFRAQGRGQIINISSAAGKVAFSPFFGFYTASKHALEGYTETLRYELRSFGIAVSLVEPGYFKSAIVQTMQAPDHPLEEYAVQREHALGLDRYCLANGRDPQLVAETVGKIVASRAPRLRYAVGQDAAFMINSQRLLPEGVVERFMRWMLLEGVVPRPAGAPKDALVTPAGLRRWFLNSPTADRFYRYSVLGGLGALGGLLAALIYRSKRRK